MEETTNSIRKSHKPALFFILVLVPVLAVSVSIFLTRRNINISSLLVNGFRTGDLLGAQDSTENSTGETGGGKFKSAFEKSVRPLFGGPKTITIKNLDLAAEVIPLDVEEDGNMEAPEDWRQAGWYVGSGYPGEDRNVVINGHYDDNSGKPAAFHALKDIKDGDTVEIKDSYGRIFSYKVLKSTYINVDDPDRLQVLEDQKDKSTLTLITCGGVWMGAEEGYSKRLIVSAELIDNF